MDCCLRAKTGALCCVAAGPHGAKSNTNSRDYSMGPNDPHWRTNSSFSPPLSRWDCRFQSDALSNGSQGAVLHGSSLSSHSKGSRSRVSSEQYPPNHHHHSISDGVLSYFGSPSDIIQGPSRWTPAVENYNSAEFSTPSIGGLRLEASPFSQSSGTRFAARMSNSFGSPSPLSESSRWESSTKQPISYSSHANFSTRRSFMSKPVYPLVFRNPVSDNEIGEAVEPAVRSRLTLGENNTSPFWPERTSSLEHKFHRTLGDLHELDASPDPSLSSRREGFRWSNASSYDMGFDKEGIEINEHRDSENGMLHSADDPKCGLCGRMMWQKSPWGSHRIVRSDDMPIAGVLSCSHVFHADCLEQTTPTSQSLDPPCPVCHKNTSGAEPSSLASEPLQMTLRTVERNQGATVLADVTGNCGNLDRNHGDSGLRRNGSLPMGRGASNSLIRNYFRKRFSFKGKTGKDLLGSKIFHETGSSSTGSHAGKNLVGCSKTRPAMNNRDN